jgi:hypothetical protein
LKERILSFLRISLAVVLLFCVVVAQADEKSNDEAPKEVQPQEYTEFHDKPITIEGYLVPPTEDSDGQYRVKWLHSEDTYILKLSEEQLEWAGKCNHEAVKIQGVYKDGGIIEPTKMCYWYLDDIAWKMVCECNRYRQAHNLAPLEPARGLLQSAHTHSYNMRNRYGFRHGGTSGWSAENIAAGQPDAASVTNTWYNSSGHRANMLNPGFRYIGVGYHNGMWTQQFR